MNAVIGNKYIDDFNNLDIEVSKRLTGVYTVDEILATFDNYYFNKMFLDITSIENYKELNNLQKLSMGLDMDKVILFLDEKDEISDSKLFLSKLVSMGIYNFTKDKNGLMYLYNNPNSYRDVAYYQNIDRVEEVTNVAIKEDLTNDRIVLGIKNVTDSAGSTTLTYLIMKTLRDYYNVMAIEIDKRDLIYFNDENCISIDEKDLSDTINKYQNTKFFIVDLNKSSSENLCDEVLYLVEPTTIKLNKLMVINPEIFNKLIDKKVIINRCLLNKKDIDSFEVESGINIFYNLDNFYDKEDCSNILLPLLEKLGYVKAIEEDKNSNEDGDSSQKKGIFGLFKNK